MLCIKDTKAKNALIQVGLVTSAFCTSEFLWDFCNVTHKNGHWNKSALASVQQNVWDNGC